MERRPFKEIMSDVKSAREAKTRFDWPPKEIAADMIVVAEQLLVDLNKYIEKNMTAPAERIRAASKAMETLGKSFRVQSTKESKHGKI